MIQILVSLALLLTITSCEKTHHIYGKTMGTTYTIKSDIFINKDIVEQEFMRINAIFSNWIPTSEVERINQQHINNPIQISPDLQHLFTLSTHLYQKTNGYFDVAIDNLIKIWGFGTHKITEQPSAKEVKNALKNSRFFNLNLQHNTLTKLKDVKLNFSAIAKGFAVDKIHELLKNKGVTSGIVEIGGEVKVIGEKNIGIERLGKKPFRITLKNEAIATSGDYRNYKIWQNEKFIHILNPHTGYPSTSNLISVSIIENSSAIADGFATAILAMGQKQAEKIIEKYHLKAVLINKNNEIYTFNL